MMSLRPWPFPPRRVGIGAGIALAAGAALLLGACAHTPESRFFTLSAATPDDMTQTQTQAPAPPANGAPLLIEVLPVNIPGQVARPQIVATRGTGDVTLEEYNRWASPLADEIGGALSRSLTGALGAIDSYRTPHPAGATVYRITVNVQRFESVPGERATIDAVWSVVRSGDALTLTCRSTASEPVAAGYDNLTAGHRKALARIAADIAQGVRTERGVPLPAPVVAATPAASAKPAASGKGKTVGPATGTHGAGRPVAAAAPTTPPPPILPCPTGEPAR